MTVVKMIYLIDDDKIFNFINSKIIAKTFPVIEVVTFENAQLALDELRKIERKQEGFPGVILDINMPEMDGWEFLNELTKFEVELLEKTKIIMLTSSIDPKDIEKSKSFKIVHDFISKPLTPDKLIQSVAD